MKPHGRDCPARCSICLGAPARRVDQAGPDLTIDGVAVRPIAATPEMARTVAARRRGGRRRRTS